MASPVPVNRGCHGVRDRMLHSSAPPGCALRCPLVCWSCWACLRVLLAALYFYHLGFFHQGLRGLQRRPRARAGGSGRGARCCRTAWRCTWRRPARARWTWPSGTTCRASATRRCAWLAPGGFVAGTVASFIVMGTWAWPAYRPKLTRIWHMPAGCSAAKPGPPALHGSGLALLPCWPPLGHTCWYAHSACLVSMLCCRVGSTFG